MDINSLTDKFGTVGAICLVVVWALIKGYAVPGKIYDLMVADRDSWRANSERWQTIAEKSNDISEATLKQIGQLTEQVSRLSERLRERGLREKNP